MGEGKEKNGELEIKGFSEDLRENNDWVLRLPIADRDWST